MLIIVFSLSLLPSAWAAKFTASVSHNKIFLGEDFTLKLELSGTSAKSDPSIDDLKRYFDVDSRGKSHNTIIINGDISSNINWTYVLTPKKEGDVTIPPISIHTSDGELSSQSITLSVGRGPSSSSTDKQEGLVIDAIVSKRDPYKSEAIIYETTFMSRYSITDLKINQLTFENAIIEVVETPKIYDELRNNIAVKVIRIRHKIIPIQSGELIIPAIKIKGKIPSRDSRLGNYSDDYLDPFGVFRRFDRWMNFGTKKLDPFIISASDITLEVKPPVPGIIPWLPSSSLNITEHWDNNQLLKVGEPITRKFTIEAEGVTASQLPSIENQQSKTDGFKIYVDNPTLKDDVDENSVSSRRWESYTLIPQTPGIHVLPEISISWWDVTSDKMAQAIVPERALEIMPATKERTSYISSDNKKEMQRQPEEILGQRKTNVFADDLRRVSPDVGKENSFLYRGIVAGLLVIIVLTVVWIIILRRKITYLVNTKSGSGHNKKIGKNSKQISSVEKKDLEKISSAREIKTFLQNYVREGHQGVFKNTPLDTLIFVAKQQCPEASREADLILKFLQDALYADKKIDLEEVKKHLFIFVEKVERRKKIVSENREEKLADLNPT